MRLGARFNDTLHQPFGHLLVYSFVPTLGIAPARLIMRTGSRQHIHTHNSHWLCEYRFCWYPLVCLQQGNEGRRYFRQWRGINVKEGGPVGVSGDVILLPGSVVREVESTKANAQGRARPISQDER